MTAIWFLTYICALLVLELMLKVKQGLPLGPLAHVYSMPYVARIGQACLMVLMYALLSAYIYGITSLLHEGLQSIGWNLPFSGVLLVVSCFLWTMNQARGRFMAPIHRGAFLALMLMIGGLLWIVLQAHALDLPTFDGVTRSLSVWSVAVPTIFTSFGFQVIFHTVYDMVKGKKEDMKRAFFWGSLLPLILYMVWTIGALGLVRHSNPVFFQNLNLGQADIGVFIHVLSAATPGFVLGYLVWGVSFLAILTSVFGVGLGMKGMWQGILEKRHIKVSTRSFLIPTLTVVPPSLIALWVPGAFVQALAFAGMILVSIAVFLPLILYQKNNGQPVYALLKNKYVPIALWFFGALIVLAEIIHMVG